MSSNSQQTIFVTGASGFLGFHVVRQLLDAGYHVRGAARGKKFSNLRNALRDSPAFEAVEIKDITSDDFSTALKGVDAVIHVAAAMPSRQDREAGFQATIDGALHILRETEKAGVKKIVVTGSIVTFPLNAGPYGVDDWHPITKEAAFASQNNMQVYVAEKKYAEQAIFAWADAHPHVDVTTVNPPFILGPLAAGSEDLIPEPDFRAFSTAGFVHVLLNPENEIYTGMAGYIDVRDAAAVHVLALKSAPQSTRKRLAVASPHVSPWTEAIRIIAEERPELKARLADPKRVPDFPTNPLGVNLQQVEEVTGFKTSDFHTWKETVLDSIDSLVSLEDDWKNHGFKVPVPTEHPL